MNIEKPRLIDLPRLVELWNAQYDFHHDLDDVYYVPLSAELQKKFEKFLKKAIEQDKPHILIAKVENEIAGFITFEESSEKYFDTNIKKFGVVVELFIHESMRQKGVGSALMKAAEKYFLDHGLTHVKLSASSFNAGAADFYHTIGYTSRQNLFFKKIAAS